MGQKEAIYPQPDDPVEGLLWALDLHRLAFIYMAEAERYNPERFREASLYETVDDVMVTEEKLRYDYPAREDYIFDNREEIEIYFSRALKQFGDGKGDKPKRGFTCSNLGRELADLISDKDIEKFEEKLNPNWLVITATWIEYIIAQRWHEFKITEIEGSRLPCWIIDEGAARELTTTSEMVNAACLKLAKTDIGHKHYRRLIESTMDLLYAPHWDRWVVDSIVEWSYPTQLKLQIDEIKQTQIKVELGSNSLSDSQQHPQGELTIDDIQINEDRFVVTIKGKTFSISERQTKFLGDLLEKR